MCWTVRTETQSDNLSASVNKESCERKQEAIKGCRLFGIVLMEGRGIEETSAVPIFSGVRVDQPVTSLEVDSEQQSQPSNVDRSDAATFSSEPENSCLKSSREIQNRQLRSCTKVMYRCSIFKLMGLIKTFVY